jgi:cobalt-precorrin-5B (C1)-methyltransferase
MARAGYTLPVFACASALACLKMLKGESNLETIELDLLEPAQIVSINIEQVAKISSDSALAITLSDPGDNLDLTRHTPIWAILRLIENSQDDAEQITILAGQGVGLVKGEPAIYSYARRLLENNLAKELKPSEKIQVTIILPEGARLAKRTSNEAFGVVGGLSLLGTTGISRPLSASEQLDQYLAQLDQQRLSDLVFCIGENGYALACKMGIDSQHLIKSANWLGPLLVAAGQQGTERIVLFGYHGKLIKLAGGIFHTHHYLADGRMEVLTSHAAILGLSTSKLKEIFACPTAEDVLGKLQQYCLEDQRDWVSEIYSSIVESIEKKATDYIAKHAEQKVKIGTFLFDRQGETIYKSINAEMIFKSLCI